MEIKPSQWVQSVESRLNVDGWWVCCELLEKVATLGVLMNRGGESPQWLCPQSFKMVGDGVGPNLRLLGDAVEPRFELI